MIVKQSLTTTKQKQCSFLSTKKTKQVI